MRYRFTLDNATLGPFVLPKNPVGWKDMSILVKRSPKYHGIFFNETVNLEFICGSGKEYLDDALNLGIDEIVTLLIEGECAEGDGYEEEYTGRVSLKTWNTINGKSTADIIEDTIADTILNRMDTPIDLSKLNTLDGTTVPLLTYSPYPLNLHSKAIIFQSELSNTEDSTDSGFISGADILSPVAARLAITFVLPVNLTELPDIAQYENFLKADDPFSPSFPDTIYTAFESGTYKINYKLLGTITELYPSDRTYSFVVAYRINGTSDPYQLLNTGPVTYAAGVPQIFNIDLEGALTLSLNQGDTFSIFAWIGGYDYVGVDHFVSIAEALDKSSFVKITKETFTPSTISKAYAISEVGESIFRSYGNRSDIFRSEYFGRKNSEPHAYQNNGCGSFRAITNGALIRNFPIADQVTGEVVQAGRPVRITGNEYFDSLNAIDNLGLGIERVSGLDYVVVEPKSHFYSNTRLFQLSNVPDIKISVAPEYYYNRFECGYETWQIKQKGGLDEVNSKRQYDLGLKTIDNPLVQISTLIAGGYPIEIARRKQYPDSFTEDFDTDNNNFIICLNRSVDGNGNPNNLTTAEKDENFISVTDVLSPETSYNLDISPGRNTLRWSPVLNVGLLKYPGRNMKFTYGEGNFKMTSQMNASSCPGRWNNQPLSEGQDIQWDDANNTDNNPLWEPLIATFKNPLTRNQFNILKANPYGYIEVSERSTTYTKWFVLEAKRNPVGGMTEFKLLKKWE